jgi:phosphohistidine phosphatase
MAIETLYIARHSLAEDHHPQHPGIDEERRLTAEGVDVATQVFRSMDALGYRPDQVWSSPLTRTHQTAEIARVQFGIRHPLEYVDGLAPHGAPLLVMERLMATDAKSVMVVGHDPGVGDLLGQLVAKAPLIQRFERAGVAAVQVYALGGRLRGELLFYAPPTLFGVL